MHKPVHVGLTGLVVLLCLVCSQPTQIEYGTLVVGVQWNTMPSQALTSSNVNCEQTLIQRPNANRQKTAEQSAEWSRLVFTLQPGHLVFEFETRQDTYAVQAELGIYNLTVAALNNDGKIVYTAFYNEILIEPNKTREIRLFMMPNFPVTAPTFVGLPALNVNNTGSYTLRWTNVSGAEYYTLNEDDDSTFASPLAPYSGPDTTFAFSNKVDGKYHYRVQANSSLGTSPWSLATVFQVIHIAQLNVKTDSLADGTAGLFYTAAIVAQGGTPPYSWSISSGELPTGLALNSTTGVISGTPTATGTFSFIVQATDHGTVPQSTFKNLVIIISPSTLQITTTSLANGQVGAAYNQSVNATGGTTPYTWSISSGELPTGLALNKATGVISGTPTAAGTFSFIVQTTDHGTVPQSTFKDLVITISPSILQITTTSLANGQVGAAYNQSVNATGGTTPYAWSISSGELPTGLALNSTTGVISGTPTAAGTFSFIVQTTDHGTVPQSTFKNLVITISPSTLQITTTSLANGQVGAAYNQSVNATGGTTPYAWSISSGELPTGLALNSATGVISGTPTAAGTFSFIVQTTDHGTVPQSTFKNLVITINPSTLQITTTSLANGQVGAAYNQSVNATGGTTPYAWSISSGELPTGLALNSATGVISGTPTAAGTFSFIVQTTDHGTVPQSTFKNLVITINPSTLQITTTSLANGQVGAAYNQSVNATGGTTPYTWSISSGELPTGLALNTATGVISGTPTATGTFSFIVQATDHGTVPQSTFKNVVITINPSTLQITMTSLANGQVGAAYNQSVNATGGTTPYAWSISSGELPTGLALNSTTGVISGTPTATGTFSFIVQATDHGTVPQSTFKNLVITINPSTLQITTTSLANGQVGAAYNQSVNATGGTTPYAWSISSGELPTGLALNTATGVISGTPTAAGTFSFIVQTTDHGTVPQSTFKNLVITISPSILQITTTSLANGQVGAAYNQSVNATGGTTPYAWSISSGELPTGLALNSATGVISGTPTAAGTFNFTVHVTDASAPAQNDTRNLSITINPPPLLITTSSPLPAGAVGSGYEALIYATGGSGNYGWAMTGGSLPPGLNFRDLGGTAEIFGTAITAGDYTCTIRVSDDFYAGLTNSKSFSIHIAGISVLTVTTSSLSDAKAGVNYSTQLHAIGGTPPYSWSEISREPAYMAEGIHCNSMGLLEGTTYLNPHSGQITLRVTDSGASPQTASKSFPWTILAGELELLDAYLPAGQFDMPYWGYISYRLGTSPLQSPWTITGDLPLGLEFSYDAGNYQLNISGFTLKAGTFNFSVTVRDNSTPQKTRTDSFTITVNP